MKTIFDPVEASLCFVERVSGEAWPVDGRDTSRAVQDAVRAVQADLKARGVRADLRSVPDTEIRAWEEVRRLRAELEALRQTSLPGPSVR